MIDPVPCYPDLIVRCSVGARYCSGILVAQDTVLTCAHFLLPERPAPSRITVRLRGTRRRAREVRIFEGTDVALITLNRVRTADDAPPGPYPPLAPPARLLGSALKRTVTFGFGGGATSPAARDGRFLITLPLAFSRSMRTIVRPAGIVANAAPAIKGDSGGPVLIDAHLAGIQSLILDPWRVNLHLATVSLLNREVREAIEAARAAC